MVQNQPAWPPREFLLDGARVRSHFLLGYLLLHFDAGRRCPSRRLLLAEQVQTILSVLGLREQLIVQLTLFSGMRPGEILALQWKHVAETHVQVVTVSLSLLRLQT